MALKKVRDVREFGGLVMGFLFRLVVVVVVVVVLSIL